MSKKRGSTRKEMPPVFNKKTFFGSFGCVAAAVALGGILISGGSDAYALDEKPFREIVSSAKAMPVGSVFYTKTSTRPGYQVYFTHMGFDGPYLKVKYEKFYHYDEIVEREIFNLPLNLERKAILLTKPVVEENPAKLTRLLITVVDELGQISVEEYKK